MNLTCTLLVLVLTSVVNSCKYPKTKDHIGSTFQVDYQWTFINFTWPSDAAYKTAISTQKYIPENNAMAGIKFYKDKFYIAMPRIRPGTPATLGYISTGKDTPKTNPLIAPYPDWKTNTLDDCTKLENVQSMEIDKNGTMWVIDGFRMKPNARCPPKLVLFDLNNDAVVQTFTFPDTVSLKQGGFLNDIVVDDSDGGFAYITDHSVVDPGLIVFSRQKNRAWKIRDASVFAEINGSNYEVDGVKFDKLAPIDGIALSPVNGTGPRHVYYCALAGLNLYSISTEILKNEEMSTGGDWRYHVNPIGEKQAQSDGMVVDNKGDLYYGLLPLYGVGRWNINEDFSTAKIVHRNRSTTIWPDSFAFDDKGHLYLLANQIHKFFNPGFKLEVTDEAKFRILQLFTSTKSYLY